jgi:hypothetical protein
MGLLFPLPLSEYRERYFLTDPKVWRYVFICVCIWKGRKYPLLFSYYREEFTRTPQISKYQIFRRLPVFAIYKWLQSSPQFHLNTLHKSIWIYPTCCISCIDIVCKLHITFVGELPLNRGFYLKNIPTFYTFKE